MRVPHEPRLVFGEVFLFSAGALGFIFVGIGLTNIGGLIASMEPLDMLYIGSGYRSWREMRVPSEGTSPARGE